MAISLKSINTASTWSKLRLLGNSHIAQSTIAVPILGYLILFNANIIDYLRLHTDFCEGAACSVSWRLYFIYFGCFFISIGASIFGLMCPSVTKKYGGASDFFEAERTYFSSPDNLNYLFKIIEEEKGSPANDPFELKIHIIGKHAALNAAHTHAIADVLGEYYILKNSSRPRYRILSLLAYAFGIALLLVPTIFTFIQVLMSTARIF